MSRKRFDIAKENAIIAQNICIEIIEEALTDYPGGKAQLAKDLKRHGAQLNTLNSAQLGTLLTVAEEIVILYEKKKLKSSKKKNRK